MLIIDTTPGDILSNAYCDLDYANDYCSTLKFCDEWNKATDEQKTAAIIQATRWLDTLSWRGVKSANEQNLEWPRRNVVDKNGYDVPIDHIPRQLKDANAEFAFRLLVKDRAGDTKAGIQIDSLVVKGEPRLLIPDSVRDLVRQFLVPKEYIPILRS